jgi:hypothetical protein
MSTDPKNDSVEAVETPAAETTEAPIPVFRGQLVEDCNYCKTYGGGMMPPHFASPYCQSGGRNHCTCGTCF